MKELFQLYIAFLKIGAVTFGGGYAMLPIIERDITEKRGWATKEELADYYAIGQCTPGLIAINTATFIGYRRKGAAGGIAATLGFATPALFIITIVASLIGNFAHHPAVQNAFAGIRVCVCILVLNAVIKLWKNSVSDIYTFCIFLSVMALSVFSPVSPALLVLASGAAGIIINILKNVINKKHPSHDSSAVGSAPPGAVNTGGEPEITSGEKGGGYK